MIAENQKADFLTQLSVLVSSRVGIHDSLSILREQSRSDELAQTLQVAIEKLERGQPLSVALASPDGHFDLHALTSIRVGEETGRLGDVLRQLSEHVSRSVALKRKVTQALAYPGLVLLVSVLASLFLLLFIVPSFAEMFRSFQVELPPSTRAVVALSEFLASYALLFSVGAVVAAAVVHFGTTRMDWSSAVRTVALRLPFVGEVIRKSEIARFCRTLGSLLQSGVSFMESLKLSGDMCRFEETRREADLIAAAIRQGRSISSRVLRSSVFPPMVAQMILVGEETSELDSMLLRIAEHYEAEISASVDTLSTLLEPIIVVVLGIIVAGILISMYLPMFDLINAVGTGG